MRRVVDPKKDITFEDPWFYVQERKFGFFLVDDEGRKFIVCHRRQVGKLSKEIGFYVPTYFVLKRARLLFEIKVRNKDRYIHYIFHPDKGTRMVPTKPDVFLSINRMECISDAVHIPRRRA